MVDTPDFFNEDTPVDEAQIQQCKKYCESQQHVILLVIQMGRFTDGERGALEKLENTFGWEIRKNTIILFTHGEDQNCDVKQFIGDRTHLKNIVEACGHRYHVFKNTSEDSKQVKALIKKHENMFPDFRTTRSFPLFCCG